MSESTSHAISSSVSLSKLSPPRLPPLVIARTHLHPFLNTAWHHPLTLLQTPAGFGKTTLVNQWLSTLHTHPDAPAISWVSLDAGDNDLFRFWRSILHACNIPAEMLSFSTTLSLTAPEIEDVLIHALNHLTQQTQHRFIVLDDYHLLHETRIHDSLTFFIDRLPPTTHIVLLSRSTPPLPLLRWRAKGELSELSSTHLRFSSTETSTFLQHALSLQLPMTLLTQLDTLLGGWPTGLRLFLSTLPTSPTLPTLEKAISSLHNFTGSISGHHSSLLTYFITEILDQQSAQTQLFLLQSSILSRLHASLCNTLTDSDNSESQLHLIAQTGLFLEAETWDSSWYRYHTLFAEAMRREARQRLGQDTIQQLAIRASRWYEQHDMLSDAIESALFTLNEDRIATLIEQKIGTEVFIDEPDTLLRWLASLSTTTLQTHPFLCFHYALAYIAIQATDPSSKTNTTRIHQLLQMAEDGWQKQKNSTWLGMVWACRALYNLERGSFALTIQYAHQALPLFPHIDLDNRMQLWHSVCLLFVGMQHIHTGELDQAQLLILDVLTRAQKLNHGYLTRQNHMALARIYTLQGDFPQATVWYQHVLTEARTQEDHELIADALLALAWITFEQNDLSITEQYIQEATTHIQFAQHQKEELQARATFQATIVQSTSTPPSLTLSHLTMQLAHLQSNPTTAALEFLPFIQEWQGRLLLTTQKSEILAHILQNQASNPQELSFIQQLTIQLLEARLLLAQNSPQTVITQLETLLSNPLVKAHTYYTLQIQLLLTLAYTATKQTQLAQQHLRSILTTSKEKQFVRLFLNEGDICAELLRSLFPTIKDPNLRTYTQNLLHAFNPVTSNPVPQPLSTTPTPLFAPLSAQEKRVLRLLASGYSNKEIAQELVVTVNTVKDHLKNLYSKLGVNSRLQASTYAQQLDLDE